MVKKLKFIILRNISTYINIAADIGKYSSLLWGISNVVGDKQDIYSVVAAGTVYAMSGVLGHGSKMLLTEYSIEALGKV